MATYALVLYLILGGQLHTFTMDHGLSYVDCMIAVASNVGTNLECRQE